MFEKFFRKNNAKKIEIFIEGMHCSSCAVNIDLSLEELPGVIKVDTNYAKSRTVIEIDEKLFDKKQVFATIKGLGYKVR